MTLLDRDKSEFFHTNNTAVNQISEPKVFSNCQGKKLSEDQTTGQITQIVELEPGWKGTYEAEFGSLEFFILKGSIRVESDLIGSGSFLAVPMGNGPLHLEAESATEIFLIFSPHFLQFDFYDGGIFSTSNFDRKWMVTEFPGEIANNNQLHGVLSQSLRWPDPVINNVHGSSKGLFRLVCVAPGFIGDHRQESHPDCWEEIFWLSGDFFMPSTGFQAPGSYLTNPPGHIHGPLVSQRGCVMLVHTDSPAGFEFHEPPIKETILEGYLEQTSWLDPPSHVGNSFTDNFVNGSYKES
tara:strand:- start:447 stop:1334 length:888 start_codon:yes stop_codon:yes gene_type:complete